MLIRATTHGELKSSYGISWYTTAWLPRCLASASREARSALTRCLPVQNLADAIVSAGIRRARIDTRVARRSYKSAWNLSIVLSRVLVNKKNLVRQISFCNHRIALLARSKSKCASWSRNVTIDVTLFTAVASESIPRLIRSVPRSITIYEQIDESHWRDTYLNIRDCTCRWSHSHRLMCTCRKRRDCWHTPN